MSDKSNSVTVMRAGRLMRPARFALCLAGAAIMAPAAAQPAQAAAAVMAVPEGQSVDDFYAARDWRPLWLRPDGSAGIEAMLLLDLLRTSAADGLDPDRYRVKSLARAVRSARGGSPRAIQRAEQQLSEAFVTYVGDVKRTPNVDIVWVDSILKPRAPSPRSLLEAAAQSSSLESHLETMGWMHPIYDGLRDALARGGHSRPEQALLRLNLERARALPAAASSDKYVIVNATAARLTMYEGGRITDSMRVVVGKPVNATPMMAAFIRYTSLNPYWNVPPDLAAERIAPNVVAEGRSYLKRQRYQVMSSWKDDARVLDPATVDWQAVADGREEVILRQLPWSGNSMGKMKFHFPNAHGIYLHDTPDKELLTEASRMFSGGCVRLEDASRLAEWMYGHPLKAKSSQPELRVDLPKPVPVYITYLTAMPSGGQIAYLPDVYDRDRREMAALGSGMVLAGR